MKVKFYVSSLFSVSNWDMAKVSGQDVQRIDKDYLDLYYVSYVISPLKARTTKFKCTYFSILLECVAYVQHSTQVLFCIMLGQISSFI